MNKTQVVAELIRVYDENEALKREVEEAKRGHQPIVGEPTSQFSVLDKLCKKKGCEEVFYPISYYPGYYPNVAVKADDDHEEAKMNNFITFDQWFAALSKRSLSNDEDSMFNDLTFNEVKQYFKEQLKATYNALVDKKKGEILASAKEAKK